MKTLDEIREQDQLAPPESDEQLQERFADLKALADQYGERVMVHFESVCTEMKAIGDHIAACTEARHKLFQAKKAVAQANLDVAQSNLAGLMLKKMHHDHPDLFGPLGPDKTLAGPSQAPPLRCEARSSNHFYAHIT